MGFRVFRAMCQENQENHPYSMQRQNAESRLTELTAKGWQQANLQSLAGDTLVLSPLVERNQTPATFDVLFWFGFGFWCLSSHRKEDLGFQVSQPFKPEV